jgi:hypothetical protein
MVERRLLAAKFVNRVRAPSDGERWVADTKIRGFGLRLWTIKGISGKAYGLRCVDVNGKAVRRTYTPSKRESLGACLEHARNWARDERDRLKDRLTVHQEYRINHSRLEYAFSRLTLRQLADAKLRGMRTRGLTEDYVTQCDKLFSHCVPLRLQRKRLSSLKSEEIAKCIKRLDSSPGKARVLRAFIGQILESSKEFHPGAWRLLKESHRLYTPDYGARRLYETSPALNEQTLSLLFTRLSAEQESPLQALFVRLLFEFDVPYERLLRAQWQQFEGFLWYPWSRSERKFSRMHRRRVEPWTVPILKRLRTEASKFAPESRFLFPSPISQSGHMRVFEAFWLRVAREVGLARHPLKKLIRAYHRDHLMPIAFRQTVDSWKIWAELSKVPIMRSELPHFLWL